MANNPLAPAGKAAWWMLIHDVNTKKEKKGKQHDILAWHTCSHQRNRRGVRIDGGEGYVSFWNSGDGYFVKNETEFRQYLNQNNSMGGLQL